MNLVKVVKFIGCLNIILLVLSIPVIFTLSWALKWYPYFRLLSTICMIGLIVAGTILLFSTIEDD